MILVKELQRCQRSKLEFGKNICQLGWPQVHGFESDRSADFFFDLQLWSLISLQPPDQYQSLVPHLKHLFHICIETKAQGFSMTFKVCNLRSKYPYFNRTYVVSEKTYLHTTVNAYFFQTFYFLLQYFIFFFYCFESLFILRLNFWGIFIVLEINFTVLYL